MARRSSARADRQAHWAVWVALAVVVGLVLLWLDGGFGDGDTIVPPPEAADRSAVAAELARATAAQGICYGWRLTSDPESRGSNLGDGVAVENQPQCPRWLKVTAFVTYTPDSSETYDSAVVSITGGGVSTTVTPDATELTRFGITEDAFIDDPGEAISRAVLMLPLLAYEHGIAPVVPPPGSTVEPTSAEPADAASLADTSGDLWRDRGPAPVFGAVALLAGVGIALVTWLRMRRGASRPVTTPSGPTGTVRKAPVLTPSTGRRPKRRPRGHR